MTIGLQALARPPAEPAQSLAVGDWLLLLLVAVGARALGYSGYFGSDEVTYTESAFKLLKGDWAVTSYVGANRFGVNLPVAAFGWLFGQNELAAAAYSLLCSLLEIGLVVLVGARLVGAQAAWWAGLVLATLPVHVHFAGRLMADAPLCLAVTASFAFFWLGEKSRRPVHWLMAGLAAGWSFWIKPAAVFYVLVLMAYPLVFRRFEWRWVWVLLGFALMVLANCALYEVLTGRFWYIFEVMSQRKGSGYLEAELAGGGAHDQAWYYPGYLFVKVYHTWLLGPLAALALLPWVRSRLTQAPGYAFVVFWAVGMLVVLSLLPISLSPLVLVPKQTNYMLMFVAPLALLAGVTIAALSRPVRRWAPGLVLLPAVLLALLLQASVAVFTANSKGVVALARNQPSATIYANTNPVRAAQFDVLVHGGAGAGAVRFIGDLATGAPAADGPERLVVMDLQTLGWGSGEPYKSLSALPACWQAAGVVTPRVDGAGPQGIQMLMALVQHAGAPAQGLVDRLRTLSSPAPAKLYRVPATPC